MPDAVDFGVCDACKKDLSATQYAVALQHHTIDYTLPGDTPDDQACLDVGHTTTFATFCSSACCKEKLPDLLISQGLAPGLAANRVFGGPLYPCAKCGGLVNLTQPHGAWTKLKKNMELVDGSLQGCAEWFDVLAVVCSSCCGIGLQSEKDRADEYDEQRTG